MARQRRARRRHHRSLARSRAGRRGRDHARAHRHGDDDRAGRGRPRQRVTIDDSWAEFAIRDGLTPEQAYSSPHAHVITRCLRSDSAAPTPPNVSVLEISGPGTLLVCSDGLWNYAPRADVLAGHLSEGSARQRATALVQMALDAGGSDNITVAVVPAGPDGVLG
jgi:serine/threonine protein phosphatase PrpC